MKTENFYENYDFQNRGFKRNCRKFMEFVKSGSNHLNNIFASMASVSGNIFISKIIKFIVFAFVDKEGIVSETGKYVDEIGIIDT